MIPLRLLVTSALAGTLMLLSAGCTSVGKPTRLNPDTLNRGPMDSWYIEGTQSNQTFSCSFVEFDGRGDYIDPAQHEAAWKKVEELVRRQKTLLIVYCHGWKNTAQSSDVVRFNSFLGRLAASKWVGGYGYRVHGLYLGWRGNLYKPYVNEKDQFYRQTTRDFGSPVVNKEHNRGASWTLALPENLSYWGRRSAAEHKVSGIPVARTIYTCASLVKDVDRDLGRTQGEPLIALTNSSRVMLLGHSFGALLLEQALALTVLDPLTKQWSWSKRTVRDGKTDSSQPAAGGERTNTVNRLPLDFVLLVNSAAPSIYAKELRDFLHDHRTALFLDRSPEADSPVFMSVTSVGDSATGVLHPLGNLLAPLFPSLRRSYTNLLQDPLVRVRQGHFYKRTPGHQPLLVDHWIVSNAPLARWAMSREDASSQVLNKNLDYKPDKRWEFLTTGKRQRSTNLVEIKSWRISRMPRSATEDPAEDRWRKKFHGLYPKRVPSAYWFIRCNKELIKDHGDVWSDTAMEMYAGLYSLVESERLRGAVAANKTADETK